MERKTGTSLFLLPHQDDEFGVFPLLDQNLRGERRCICVYLTDGAGGGANTARRDGESRAALALSGIGDDGIAWLGGQSRIPDKQLAANLPRAFDLLNDVIETQPISSVFTPAWEGGHPDHDAAVLLSAAIGRQVGARVFQFPLYNSFNCRFLPFALFNPIPSNGTIFRIPYPERASISHVRRCLTYRSQAKTWAMLLPQLAMHRLTRSPQILQELLPNFPFCRPHSGNLLYERRRWLNWEQFDEQVSHFKARYLGLLSA